MAGKAAGSVSRRQRRKAARLAESAARYDPALERRRTTAAALDRLSLTTWTVMNGVPWPGRRGSKIDHVVIGPAGVFVITSVESRGAVRIWEESLLRQGRSLQAAEEAGWAVSQLMPSVPMRMVHPVVCLVRDEPVDGQIDDVLVCSSGNVVQVLDSRVPELSQEQLRVAPMLLRAHILDSSAASVPPAPPPTLAPTTPEPPRRTRFVWPSRQEAWRRGRKQPGLVLPLITTVCAAIVFIVAPGAVIAGAQAFAQLFADYLAR